MLQANFFDALLIGQIVLRGDAFDLFGFLTDSGDFGIEVFDLFGDFGRHFVDLATEVIEAHEPALLFAENVFAVGDQLLVFDGLAAELLFFDLDFFEDFAQFGPAGVFGRLECFEAGDHTAVALVSFPHQGKKRGVFLF